MAAPNLDPGPPVSSWARKFGADPNDGSGEPVFSVAGRSFLDPVAPEIDPWTLKELADQSPPQTGADFDSLFLSEVMQKSSMGGLRTWEAVELLPTSDPGPETELVVREDGWNRILNKNRFIDLDVRVKDCMDPAALIQIDSLPDSSQPALKRSESLGIWSVDNEVVWKELKVCIELAQRILYHSSDAS